MAFNKNKTVALAQKFVQKSQFDRAIKEYLKILEAEPKDIRTRLKVGDLYAKKGDNTEAARIYQEVAESYAKDGFFLRAVAVYKNILKLCPDLIQINLKLGDLYHQLSLLGDAMTQYQIVVNYYDRHGMVKESLDTLKKMVELDPENITFKVNLAELYHKEGHIQQAMKEFESIALDLRNQQNKDEELIKVYEKIIHHDPKRLEVIKDLSRSYIATQQPQKALAKLQISFKNNPKDTETLELLAQVFMLLNQPKKAKSVFKELYGLYDTAKDTANKSRIAEELVKVAPGDREIKQMVTGSGISDDASVSSFSFSVSPEVTGLASSVPPSAEFDAEVKKYDEEVTEFTMHSEGSLLDPIGMAPIEVPEITPPPLESPMFSPSESSSPPPAVMPEADDYVDIEEEINKLMTETEVYLKYGLADKAREHLAHILSKDPRNTRARLKLKELHLSQGDKSAAIQELQTVIENLESGKATGGDEDIQKIKAELAGLTGVAAKPAAVLETPKAPGPKVIEIDEIPEMELDLGIEIEMPDMVEPPVEISASDLNQELVEPLELETSAAPKMTAPVGLDLTMENEPSLASSAPEIAFTADVDHADNGIQEDAQEEVAVDLAPEMPIEETADSNSGLEISLSESNALSQDSESVPMEVREELDEAEFFIQQGLEDEARKIFEDLLERFPENALVNQEVRKKLEQGFPTGKASVAKKPTAAPTPAKKVSKHSKAATAEIEMEEDVLADMGEGKVFEISSDEVSVGVSSEPIEESFDLAAELSSEFQAVEEEIEDAGESEQVDFKEVFEEFKKGVAQQIGNEDTETHFDLGLAYKEMHLFEDAIREFEIALSDNTRFVECQTMIGICYMDKGDFKKGEKYFQKGLSAKNLKASEIIGLSYELGMAQVALGNLPQALESMRRVQGLDPNFRDVSARIKELQKGVKPQMASRNEEESFDLRASLEIDDEGRHGHGVHKSTSETVPVNGDKEDVELTDLSAFDTPSEKTLKSFKSPSKPVANTASEKSSVADSPMARSYNKKPDRKTKSKISYL